MSNGQRPPGNQGNPWAQQDPNWRPQQFHDAAARDPRVPFGQQQPPPDPQQLSPSGPPRKVWVIIVVAVVAIAIGLFSLQFFMGVDPESTNPGERPAVPQPTATRTGNFKPFDGAVTGVFELTATRWTDQGLEVDYRIEVDMVAEFSFFAYTNASRESFIADNDPLAYATPETPATGTLVFPMPQEDSTIVLAGPRGNNAIQALPVKAP
ncbi:hypothetical protein [Tessaracoccus caeni]|uniref:hypothetical protein n=1 Tax=Tessaracoccus caeni TaxID=3031239 RepID=UPI0023D9D34A|nr:hypothetical protein [Tessaracoccus caeni]MDF1489561.1 hypothetical protein [Tessaracoccus caeni]